MTASTRDLGEPLYLIKGLLAQPLREWTACSLGPAFFVFLAILVGDPDSFYVWLFAGIAVLLVVLSITSLARGRIGLYPDRIRIHWWGDSFERNLVLPFVELREIAVDGSAFRIGYVSGDVSKHATLRLLAPVAEELYDRLVEQVEQDPELRDCVVEQGTNRLVITPKTGRRAVRDAEVEAVGEDEPN